MGTNSKSIDPSKSERYHPRYNKGKSKHPRGVSEQNKKLDWQSHWYCDNCNFGAMTPFLEHCPGCQHHRCQNCRIEKTQICIVSMGIPIEDTFNFASASSPASEPNSSEIRTKYQVQPIQADNPPTLKSLQGANYSTLLETGSPSIDPSEIMYSSTRRINQEPQAMETPFLPTVVQPELITTSSPSDSSSFSTPKSSNFSEANSDYASSETDFDSYDTQAEIESIDFEPTSEQERAMPILEGHLLSILHNHLDLAACLIPEIHRRMNLHQDLTSGSSTASHERIPGGSVQRLAGSTFATSRTGTSSGLGQGSSDTTSFSLSIFNTSAMRLQKRRRGFNESEQQSDEEGSKRPKPDPPSTNDFDGLQRRKRKSTYACHFHKFNPGKYGPWTNVKYRTCIGPGPIELRRIKDHFKASHRPFQCVKCYGIFKDIDELQEHQRSEICSKNLPALKEGIDDGQWAKIESIIKAKKGISLAEKRKHDIEKWFDIWRIIFPGVSPPSNPWNDAHQSTVAGTQLDFESIISTFENSIKLDAQKGTIQIDDDTHQRYLHALKVALTEAGVISADISRGSSGLSSSAQRDQIDLQQNDFQHDLLESENLDSVGRMPFEEGDRSDQVSGDGENHSKITRLQGGYPSQPSILFCGGVEWGQYSSIEPTLSDRSNLDITPTGLMDLPITDPMFNLPLLQSHESAQNNFPPTQSQANPTQNLETGERQNDVFFGINLDSLQEDEVLNPWLGIEGYAMVDSTELLYSDARQDDFDVPPPSDFGLVQPRSDMINFPLCSDPVLESLNSESELSVAREHWRTRFDGNMMRREVSSRYRQE
ncbi:hypothetical protein BGZ60DRAFT_417808 [Tricladium varicosporioides]|nr:hypothetical protein BGZ60DRAFT_417808 [Hymenoscyphus varicosporioides]